MWAGVGGAGEARWVEDNDWEWGEGVGERSSPDVEDEDEGEKRSCCPAGGGLSSTRTSSSSITTTRRFG